jgi:Nickel responsive protein SCO4226-like
MSLFIDVHDLPGPVSMEEAAEAHAADRRVQPEFGVRYLRYWVDEPHGKIFALVDAPDALAAHAVHRMAHGLVPGAIFPVREGH